MKFLRKFIDVFTQFLGRLKKNRKINPKTDSFTKINLGAGLAVAPGWTNIDGSLNSLVANFPRIFHVLSYYFSGSRSFYSKDEYCKILYENQFMHHDIKFGVPFNDQTVDYIFSSHFLEHLYLNDAKHLLRDCYRALKKGGRMRISVPDLEYAFDLYKKGEAERMLSSYFFINDDSFFAQHKYMYDYTILSSILNEIGFVNISRSEYREGDFPDVNLLDNRKEESLFIEAYK
jgi:SAM-dependent methyltransferase